MQSIQKTFWTGVALASLISISAFAQDSLGDIARRVRMQKPAPAPGARVIDNDTIPIRGNASATAAAQPSEAETGGAAAATGAASGQAAAGAATAADREKEKQKAADAWQSKIAAQKDSIALMERELNVLQRENQIATAVYYADAGTQLRDPKKFGEQVRSNKDAIDAKQKAIQDAKQTLDDMQEQARKAGVPAAQRE
jgi:hypothetical protein